MEETFHFLEVVVFTVAEAWWAVSIIAVDAEVAVFVARNHILASVAFARNVVQVLGDHRLVTAAVSVFLNALSLLANTEALLLSSEQDELVCQVVDHVVALGVQLLDVELLDAVMSLEFDSGILFVAHLAHNFDLRAISLDVVVKLSTGHVLELLSIADIAAKLGALVLGVCLQLSESLPDDLLAISLLRPASVRELTEVNAVSKDLVHLLHEVSSRLAVGAADVVLWSHELLPGNLSLASASCVDHV